MDYYDDDVFIGGGGPGSGRQTYKNFVKAFSKKAKQSGRTFARGDLFREAAAAWKVKHPNGLRKTQRKMPAKKSMTRKVAAKSEYGSKRGVSRGMKAAAKSEYGSKRGVTRGKKVVSIRRDATLDDLMNAQILIEKKINKFYKNKGVLKKKVPKNK